MKNSSHFRQTTTHLVYFDIWLHYFLCPSFHHVLPKMTKIGYSVISLREYIQILFWIWQIWLINTHTHMKDIPWGYRNKTENLPKIWPFPLIWLLPWQPPWVWRHNVIIFTAESSINKSDCSLIDYRYIVIISHKDSGGVQPNWSFSQTGRSF